LRQQKLGLFRETKPIAKMAVLIVSPFDKEFYGMEKP
jgi:hypothetical protein